MTLRYFVEDTSNVLKIATDYDDEPTPANYTAVLRSTIQAAHPGPIFIGGTWDGTNYEHPTTEGILLPDDTTTDIGQRKAAARTLHKRLLNWTEGLIEEGAFHPASEVEIGHDFILYAHHAAYVVFNSSTWTAAQQIAWADKMSTGALDVTNPHNFYQRVHTLEVPADIPTAACAWVNPNDGAAVNLNVAWSMSDSTADNGWFNGEDVDLTAVQLSNGGWIDLL